MTMQTFRNAIMTGALCAVVAASAAAQAADVRVTADKKADFSRFKTYSWTQSQPAQARATDQAIVAAIDHELSGLGLTKATGGDVVVTYSLLPDEIAVGMLDAKSRKRLLQLRTDTNIAGSGSQADVDRVVSSLFEHYPTRMSR
jgi:hypothetical protein